MNSITSIAKRLLIKRSDSALFSEKGLILALLAKAFSSSGAVYYAVQGGSNF